MNILYLLKPGLKIKRWILTGVSGIVLIILGISSLVNPRVIIDISDIGLYLLILFGIVLWIFSFIKLVLNTVNIIYYSRVHGEPKDLNFIDEMYDKRLLSKGIKVVVIGGGTGLSVLLRGIKKFTSNITAIVTVADDGGGSGKIREDLGMLPPGDIRNCILALANTEPIMEKLLQYRFKEGVLKGQSFGNLLIAAMVGISNNFEHAIKRINDIFAVTGKVLPVTTEDITLYARLKNNQVIKGESDIPVKSLEAHSQIERVFIKPKKVKPLNESIDAILDADVIILGPGSLYTSIIPNLLVDDIVNTIDKSSAIKAYVANVMTQPGETDGYSVTEHLEAIKKHTNDKNLIEYLYINNEKIPEICLSKYKEEGARPVYLKDEDKYYLNESNINYMEDNFIEIKSGYVRHDATKLSKAIISTVIDKKYSHDRIRFMELMTIMKRAKDI